MLPSCAAWIAGVASVTAVERRAIAASPTTTTARADLAAAAAAVRAPPDAQLFSAWNQPYSRECSWSASPAAVAAQALIPTWLRGRWTVEQTALDGVSFPIGRRVLSESVPGVRMASIIYLPNVGATPSAWEVTFGETADSERAANLGAQLEAFWPASRVLSATSPRAGTVRLRYSSPTKSLPSVNQTVTAQLCSSEGGLVDDDEFVLAEVVQQDNEAQGTRGEYEILTSFRRDGDGGVRARQRVAAFLQPTDGAYFETAGKAVALYDYSYVFRRR